MNLRPLRSVNNFNKAYVRFSNLTERSVDIIWINYLGGMSRYRTLEPEKFLDVNTYETHPWICVDRASGQEMLLDFKTVYIPRGIDFINRQRPFRILVSITLPLFSLRSASLQVVLKSLTDIEDVEKLTLPLKLREDLRELNKVRDNILKNCESAAD